jgi:hypothetical protein
MQRLLPTTQAEQEANLTHIKKESQLVRITGLFNNSDPIELKRLSENCTKIGYDPKTGKKLIDKHYRNNIEKPKKLPKEN